jgi:hypothetical protein
MVKLIVGVLVLGFLAGCDVASAPPSTGGTSFDASTDAPGSSTVICERGVVVVTSDYKSTNIAIANLRGTTLSGSFVSSGSTKPGLSLALSGDVDVPFVAPASERLVLLDRYGTNVLTWMDVATAKVLAQLPVGRGFESNPHDYLEVDATRAFVSRYGTNPSPGAQAFDAGGDLLIVDTVTPAIVGSIPMPEENAALQPRPDGMVWIGSEVVVSLDRMAADFSQTGDGRFVGVSPSTNTVDWIVDVTGLQACGRVAVSPSGRVAAIACSSKQDMTTNKFDPSKSDVVVYDATQSPPKELRRLGLGTKLGAGLQPQITFANEETILALTYGGNATPGDTIVTVNTSTAAVTPVSAATKPYVLGGMHCSPGCGDACLLGDAERNRLRRWQVNPDGTFLELDDSVVDTAVGLPPRTLGGL